jgi:uncharacterized membrane protein YfcA
MLFDSLFLFDFNPLAVVLGALVGLVLGLTGAGGGVIAVPLLVFGLNLPLAQAAPVGLLASGLAAGLGAVLGLREGIVRYRAALLIGLCGMLVAPLGVWLAGRLPNAPLLFGFSLILLFSAWRAFRQSWLGADAVSQHPQPCRIDPVIGRFSWTQPCARALAGTGLLAGLFSGLFGVGGGFVIVPALSRHTDLDMRSIFATSLAVITLVACGSVAAAALHGTVQWLLALPFSGGALAGLLLGRRLADRLAGARLQQSFATLCLCVALLLMGRASGWLAI